MAGRLGFREVVAVVLTAVVLVGAAGCSEADSLVDRWRENGLLAEVPVELVRTLQAERGEAVLEALGTDGLMRNDVAWSDTVPRTDEAVSALVDGVTGDEVAEDVYAEVLSELEGLEDIRSIVAAHAPQEDRPDLSEAARTAADTIRADYTAVIGVVLDASAALSDEVEDDEVALGIGLYVEGLRQTEGLATFTTRYLRALAQDDTDPSQESDLGDSLEDLESGPSRVVEQADGTIYEPPAAAVESAVESSTSFDEIVAADAVGEPIEMEVLLAVSDDLSPAWHNFVTEVQLSVTHGP